MFRTKQKYSSLVAISVDNAREITKHQIIMYMIKLDSGMFNEIIYIIGVTLNIQRDDRILTLYDHWMGLEE